MKPALKMEGRMKRAGERGFARRFSIAVLGGSAVLLLAAQTPLNAASPASDLKKIFSRMDRQLCRSLSLANCKRQHVKKKAKTKTGKAARPKPAKPKASLGAVVGKKKKPADPEQVPVLKDVKPEVIPNLQSLEKSKVPTPTLKPASVFKKLLLPSPPTPVLKKASPLKPPASAVVILPKPVVPTPVLPLPPSFPPPPHAMPDGTLTGEACYESLGKLGVKFTQVTTNVGNGVCAVSDAVQLHSISIGADVLKLFDQPTLTCGFAIKFVTWMRNDASPLIQTASKTSIAAFGTGPGYQCRGRNGDITAKLSEHAFGNAVDIERIKLANGEIIDVADAIKSGAKFQPVLTALRASACQYFTTVLGPGTNEAHATHFHFDLARRGKKGDHKMCQ